VAGRYRESCLVDATKCNGAWPARLLVAARGRGQGLGHRHGGWVADMDKGHGHGGRWPTGSRTRIRQAGSRQGLGHGRGGRAADRDRGQEGRDNYYIVR